MFKNWLHALRSRVFIAYLLANLVGLLIAIILSLLWKEANIYTVSITSYSLSIAAPLIFDLINNTPRLNKDERTEIFIWSIFAFIIFLLLTLIDPKGNLSIWLSISMMLITLLLWGGIYSKDEKMDVKFPPREVFDNSISAMKELRSGSRKRDVDYD